MQHGDIRIGVHAGIYAGGSDTYVSDLPEPEPTPAAVLPGIFSMMGAAWRKRKGGSDDVTEK